MFQNNNIWWNNAQNYEIDTTHVPKELEWKYEIILENCEKIKWFSPEFLEKIAQFWVNEKVISIISSWMQDRHWNISWWAHLEIWKIRWVNFQVTNEVYKNIRVTPKSK